MKVCRLLAVLFVAMIPWATAQVYRTGNLKVRVTYENDRSVTVQVHVKLMSNGSNNSLYESYTDRDGMVEFYNVPVGNYHMLASGEGIQETDSGLFEVDPRKTSQYLYIRVRRTQDAEKTTTPSGAATISTADLNIPENARQEFDKASDLIAAENWNKALEHLNKAVAIYPKYAAAYNNVGVVYARLGNRTQEREALNKAIGLDDHFASAYTNLGRMAIADRDFATAETLLNKSAVLDPSSAPTLVLLANVELLNQHYDEAIANARRAHALPDAPHALAHYVAGRALAHKNLVPDALAELQTFLNEEPVGPRADAVRREIAGLQAQHP